MNKKYVINRIGYNYIPTRDIDASIEWYINHLNLKLMSKFVNRGSCIGVLHFPHTHSIALVLIETNDDHPLYIKRNHDAFPIMSMNCSDIDYTYNQLKSMGCKIDEIQSLGEGEAKYFFLEDLDGNLIEIAWSIWDTVDSYKEEY